MCCHCTSPASLGLGLELELNLDLDLDLVMDRASDALGIKLARTGGYLRPLPLKCPATGSPEGADTHLELAEAGGERTCPFRECSRLVLPLSQTAATSSSTAAAAVRLEPVECAAGRIRLIRCRLSWWCQRRQMDTAPSLEEGEDCRKSIGARYRSQPPQQLLRSIRAPDHTQHRTKKHHLPTLNALG